MARQGKTRLDEDSYYMKIAMAVRARANCLGNRVGAVLVLGNRIISTGYNGTPEKTDNCMDGGCYRCKNREKFGPGKGYDLCICVHAEQNTLLSAARFGIPVEGSVLYTTMRPCFGCTKELLQAKIAAVHFLHDWRHPNANLVAEYKKLQGRFRDGIKKLTVVDPDEAWAVSAKRSSLEDTGHSSADVYNKSLKGRPRGIHRSR